ncbi:GNAT family N-acetyltransferase [Nocardia lijiangensis]|uniref:GNAT family N-acetyltransferase n=1 Tax=Nocardia lijiangensis TaxID=299618 RepID=UPI003D71C2AC
MSDDPPSSETPGSDPALQVRARRAQAWSNFHAARIALADLRIRTNLQGRPAWLGRLPGGAYERAERRLDRLRRELGRHGVGADEHAWGLLSGGETTTLDGMVGIESTIAVVAPRFAVIAPQWARQLRSIARDCPFVREQAAEGDRRCVDELTHRLLEAVRLAPSEAARQRLIDHLPGERRPIPSDVAQLRRRGPSPIEIDFEIHTSTIELGAITVTPALRGMGLGSAGLTHLCRTADAHRLDIVGQLLPTFRDDDAAIPALARWCRGHGFTVHERLGGRISRAPATPKPPAPSARGGAQV